MKTLAFLCRYRKYLKSIEYLVDNLYSVLGDYVHISLFFLDELKPGQQVEADAYLVLYEEMLGRLTPHIPDYTKVVVLTRSIKKKNLQSVMDIPPGTDVLVINDSRESVLQTIRLIYELGVSHLRLYPYDQTIPDSGLYHRIDTCIVASGAEHLIPAHILHIHNINNREISFETFQKLISLLKLENPSVRGNLLRKTSDELDTGANFIHSYLGSFLKELLLSNVVKTLTQAIILLDYQLNIHYINEKGYDIFHMVAGDNLSKSPLYFERLVSDSDYRDEWILFGEQAYLTEKRSFLLQDRNIGFCLILSDASQMRSTEQQAKDRSLAAKYTFRDIVCQAEAMKACIDLARKAAASDHTILIRGESGVGKELFAQSIHNDSLRKRAPFVAVNCAALPESLLESELFGYEPGAFTGAQKSGRAGLFEQAQHGTVFLDEIGDISPGLQAHLLRVLQEKQLRRIGSDKVIDIDVRIIAATNGNLEAQIASGTFRSDLFFRLNVISLRLAPLRERREDILPLLRTFLGQRCNDLSPKELDCFLHYPWPGNVRELQNAASYYRTLGTLPEYLRACEDGCNPLPLKTFSPIIPSSDDCSHPSEEDVRRRLLQLIADATQTLSGIGRKALMNQLRLQGLQVGEGKLKRLLAQCQQEGLIQVCRGRSGSQITEQGRRYLQTPQQ